MKLGCCSGTSPFPDGIIAIGYPHASANSINAFCALATLSFGPPMITGFTALFKNSAVASTAASNPNWLLTLVYQLMSVFQVIHHGLRASDGLKTPKLLGEIRQADGVVQDPVSAVIVRVWAADDANHRQILTVGAGDGVEHAQPAHREGDHTRAHPVGPSIAVRSVAGVELVTAADQAQLRLGDQVIQQRQVEVPRDGENIFHANLDKPLSQVAPQRSVQAALLN
nr:hypothetical protein CR513_06800 [Ipomoea batatas]